jgi:3-methyladenine DNA glycosylase AlkC
MKKNADKKLNFRIPDAPHTILKGSSLASLLDREAIDCLAHNICLVYSSFDGKSFQKDAVNGLSPLGIIERGHHIARALRTHLPQKYEKAIDVLLDSLTPPLPNGDGNGLGVFFYHPHVCFVANYGLDKENNGGDDPFEISLKAQYELTRRFSAEFSIRPFLIRFQERTLARIKEWTKDSDVHVRRFCSEGTRPRLPWAIRIPAFIKDPKPVLPILEALKDDPQLYVRRSVANHLGDIAKDHPELMFAICEHWLDGASADRKWIIRHALRHPAKKGVKTALKLRKLAL